METWPQLTTLANTNPRVFCDDCTREKYGVDNGDQFVTVKLKVKPKPKYVETDPDMPERRRKPAKKKTSMFVDFMKQEGLFDA